jgi:hypothetical protein
METNRTQAQPTGKSCLPILVIMGLIILAAVVYYLPVTQEWRTYRAITHAESKEAEEEAVNSYIVAFPYGKHIEEVLYRNVQLHPNDESSYQFYLDDFPQGEYAAEVNQQLEQLYYRRIRYYGTQMTNVTAYLQHYPQGAYADEVNRICDSIWDSKLDNYRATKNTKKSAKAVRYFEALLDYMKTHRQNQLTISTHPTIHLKDYSEYSREIREVIETPGNYSILLPVKGNVVSIKENFSSRDKAALNNILSDGLQKSFDEIFTPGFIQVVTGSYTANKNETNPTIPMAQFDYVINSQEDVIGGKRYPHLWTYAVNNLPKNYLVGISISFHVRFTIPDSDVIFEYSGKGTPEKDIPFVVNISDGYRRMTEISFSRFADDMYAKFGLAKVYDY